MIEFQIGSKLKEEEYTSEVMAWLDANNYYLKDIQEGDYIYEVTEVPKPSVSEQQSYIRLQRKSKCFSIINRGELWYVKLTDEQKAELSVWYEAWLNAPQTLVIPETPKWIK